MLTPDRPIRELLTERLVDADPSTTLRAAAAVLDDENVGAVLVRDVRGIVGIATERDAIRALSDGADPDLARIDEYLSDDLVSIADTSSLRAAVDLMRRHEIRHVVVEEAGGALAGVVSMRSIVHALFGDVVSAT